MRVANNCIPLRYENHLKVITMEPGSQLRPPCLWGIRLSDETRLGSLLHSQMLFSELLEISGPIPQSSQEVKDVTDGGHVT